MGANLNESNLIEYLNGIRDAYAKFEEVRDFSSYLFSLKKNISMMNLISSKVNALQFIISDSSGKDSIKFWIEFDSNKVIFDVFTGINPNPVITFRISELETAISIFNGTVWKIQEIIHTMDPKISIILQDTSNFSMKKLGENILIDFTGNFNKFGTYFWPAIRD